MQFFIMLVIFVFYVYINHNKFSKESKIAWNILLELNYTKESAYSLIAILDEYTNLNPFYVDKNLLEEEINFTDPASYINQDIKIDESFLDEIPLGINKFISSEEKKFLKKLALEKNKGIFDLQIQLQTLDYFQKNENLFIINNIDEAVQKYLEKFY